MPYLIVREMGNERCFALTDDEMSIGRSRQNPIQLETEQSSRKHCTVRRAGPGWRVVDERSSNGTFVNGLKVDEKDLSDGDLIGIGGATITYKIDEPSPGPAARVTPDDSTAAIPLQDRSVQILIQTIIGAAAAPSIDDFLRTAVDNLIEITDAERGLLFVMEGGELRVRVGRDHDHATLGEVAGISRSIPRQVFDSGKAIFLLDTAHEDEPVPTRSMEMYQLRTVMCAPLQVGEKRLGVLYVDSHAKAREYSAADLALFEGIAGYLALTIENIRAQQDRERREEEKRASLERENVMLRTALTKRQHLIGECPPMQAVYETLQKVAPTEATVLILGESGTGKEAIAHVIHELSPRGEKPFVVIDCAAIPENLLESELFGYEKGAFTGAAVTKPGKMELAQGGTLFLDEIAELSPGLQVKLLRALEQKVVTRVGGNQPIKIEARFVTATNRDLEDLVKTGRFRQDLLFRLKVITVTLPPLRERGTDIPLLAEFLLAESNRVNGRSIKGIAEDAMKAIQSHPWEGNIRELKHRIEQAVILSDREILTVEDLNLAGPAAPVGTLESARDQFEKTYIVRALAQNLGNVTQTARALGISRQHLQTLIKKYGISRLTDAGE
ncbi:MAG TPA: sigma 54-interacting transcriptional regulator [Planctomycetota bacterium]|jgi:transcriptional regulator with GAF, ATPase, and Fis domain